MLKRSVLSLTLACLAPAAGYAQPPAERSLPSERRTMAAVRLNDGESIEVDGRLDEPWWRRAVPAANFVQQDPDNGAPATEATEVRILYTRDALYIGVTCFDSESPTSGWAISAAATSSSRPTTALCGPSTPTSTAARPTSSR